MRRPPAWLRALGREELPERVTLEGREFQRAAIFKHDFFAATGVYEERDEGTEGQRDKGEEGNPPGPPFARGGEEGLARGGEIRQIVVKVYRVASLCGLPMRWSGRWQARHEGRMYRLLAGIEGVPRFCGEVGTTGFAHEYVPGHPLDSREVVDDEFFPWLGRLLDEVHARGAAYVDLEKRENILVGEDGRPHLIDFQISFHWPWRVGGSWWPVRAVRRVLQNGDRYHLLKHRRRLRPDQLSEEERRRAERVPLLVRVHRMLFRPFTVVRRRVLIAMGVRQTMGREGEK